MPEGISTEQLRGRLPEVVEKVKQGKRFTVLHRNRPAFDIVPVGSSQIESVPLELDSLYRAPPVGSSKSRHAARRHDEVLYR